MKYTAAELSETFTELLRGVAGLLDSLGIPWMLVGGLAAGAWTEPRGTKDCDLAVSLTGPVDRLRQGLEDLGLRSFHGDLAAAAGGGAVRLRLDRSGAPPLVMDLLCAGTDFEREALANRRTLEVLGVTLWIVSPDDLVLYKLIAGRPQDLADIDRLIRFGRSPEDPARLRRWAREWEVEDRLDHALETARR